MESYDIRDIGQLWKSSAETGAADVVCHTVLEWYDLFHYQKVSTVYNFFNTEAGNAF